MNFKPIGISTMMVGAAALVIMAEPVRAASIGGETLSFGGAAQLNDADNIGETATIEFSGPHDIAVTSAFGTAGTPFTVNDLDLEKTSATTWTLASGPVTDWLTGLPNGVKYTLNAFDLTEVVVTLPTSTATFYSAAISGVFQPANVNGTGAFTSQGNFEISSDSYSANITAGEEIPTPALLPALVGMGAAALRKRSASEEETVEA